MKNIVKILLMASIILILPFSSWAANTIVYGTQTVGLSAIDTNYDFGADSTLGTPGANKIIEFIMFKPSAAGDVICILDGANANKPALLYATAITGDTLVVYLQKKCRPYLVVASCTFNTAANVRVTIGYKASSYER